MALPVDDLNPKPSDSAECLERDEIYEGLADLLPIGQAWDTHERRVPSDRPTMIRKFIYGIAGSFLKVDDLLCQMVNEAFCPFAVEFIELWQTEYGIPDPCEIFNASVCEKVRGSDNLSPDYLTALLSNLGVFAQMRWLKGNDEEFPGTRSTLRVLVDPEQSPALLEGGVLPFEVGEELGVNSIPEVTCALERIIPAHCAVITGAAGEFDLADLGAKLKLFYHADDTVNGEVLSWVPRVGAINATGLTGAVPTSAVSDGIRYLEFDGVNDALTTGSNPVVGADSELFILARIDPVFNERSLITSHTLARQLNIMSRHSKFRNVITSLGLLEGSKLLLDAGDELSYTTGQTFTDRSEENLTDFYLGNTNAVTVADPTFNGVAGSVSPNEFFSHDGGDYFQVVTQPAWVQTLHKDNAKFTFAFLVKLGAIGTNQNLMGTASNAGHVGLRIILTVVGNVSFTVWNGTAIVATLSTTGNLLGATVGNWAFIAVAVDETAGTASIWVNSTRVDGAFTYASPSSASATFPLQICADGNGVAPLLSGAQIISVMAWTRRLTNDEVTALRLKLMERFVTTPSLNLLRLRHGTSTLTDAGLTTSGLTVATAKFASNVMYGRVQGHLTNPVSDTAAGMGSADGTLKIGGGTGFFKGGVRFAGITSGLTPTERLHFEAWLAWEIERADLLANSHPYRNLRP